MSKILRLENGYHLILKGETEDIYPEPARLPSIDKLIKNMLASKKSPWLAPEYNFDEILWSPGDLPEIDGQWYSRVYSRKQIKHSFGHESFVVDPNKYPNNTNFAKKALDYDRPKLNAKLWHFITLKRINDHKVLEILNEEHMFSKELLPKIDYLTCEYDFKSNREIYLSFNVYLTSKNKLKTEDKHDILNCIKHELENYWKDYVIIPQAAVKELRKTMRKKGRLIKELESENELRSLQ